MLQNARVTAFPVSELLRVNQYGSKITHPSLRLGLTHLKNIPQMYTEYIQSSAARS